MLKKLRSALVTGANGFIGSALVRRLASESFKVSCLVRKGSSPDRLRNGLNVSVIAIDRYAPETLRAALDGLEVDVVFNLASAGVNPADREPWTLLNGNVQVIVDLLLALHAHKPERFIHIGSCAEYAPVTPGHRINEEDAVRSTSLYGAAKICAFTYGSALAAQQGIPFAALRLFGVFGGGEASYRLIPYLVARLSADQTVDLTPGEQVRDWLYVDDVVDALILAASTDSLHQPGLYNVCSGEGISVRRLAEEVAKVMNKPTQLLKFGARAYRSDEAMWIVGDAQRFKTATGWLPRVSIQEGIQRVVAQAS
jgi:UDP-glucose 4-epimerase